MQFVVCSFGFGENCTNIYSLATAVNSCGLSLRISDVASFLTAVSYSRFRMIVKKRKERHELHNFALFMGERKLANGIPAAYNSNVNSAVAHMQLYEK